MIWRLMIFIEGDFPLGFEGKVASIYGTAEVDVPPFLKYSPCAFKRRGDETKRMLFLYTPPPAENGGRGTTENLKGGE